MDIEARQNQGSPQVQTQHELHQPYILRNPPKRELYSPQNEVDFEEFGANLAVYSPFDEDRIRDLEHWAQASDKERGHAFVAIMSIVDAMQGSIRPKQPLQVKFPRPYTGCT